MTRNGLSWRQPYLIVVVCGSGLCAQYALPVSDIWHKLIMITLTLVMFGWLAVWSWTSNAALEEAALVHDIERQAAERGVSRTPVQAHYLVAQERHARNYHHGNN